MSATNKIASPLPSNVGSFSEAQIDHRLNIALTRLIEHDRDLFIHDANERSICARLAFYLQAEFPDFHVDCEYNRHHHDEQHFKRLYDPDLIKLAGREPEADETDSLTVFPDIIVHRRETDDNLLVIEAKKTTSSVKMEFDLKKLEAFQSEMNYRHAKFIRFGTKPNEQPIVENRFVRINPGI
jgi:hypothetical protein